MDNASEGRFNELPLGLFLAEFLFSEVHYTMNKKQVRALTEGAIMIALATVLSIFKIVDLPYGGSITLASMLPIAVISYRHGIGWGFISAFVYGVIQQLLGLNTLSYVTTWQSVLAVILLDYIIAFAVIGVSGVFRKKIKSQTVSLVLGSFLACLLRYACHVISGATVWAGLSIPTQAALSYSFIYNATYMVPETIIVLLFAAFLGSNIDLNASNPMRIKTANIDKKHAWEMPVSIALIVSALAFDTFMIFAHLQNAETGEFDITQLSQVSWLPVIIVTAVAAVAGVALLIDYSRAKTKAETSIEK